MNQQWQDMVFGDPEFSGTAEGHAVAVYASGVTGDGPTIGEAPGRQTETLYVVFPDDTRKVMFWPIGWRSWTAEQRQSRLEDESLIDQS